MQIKTVYPDIYLKSIESERGVYIMFNFPVESFWFIVPWPFIWLALGIFMYFRKKRDDDLEEQSNCESREEVKN